jgi:hypothetical protein
MATSAILPAAMSLPSTFRPHKAGEQISAGELTRAFHALQQNSHVIGVWPILVQNDVSGITVSFAWPLPRWAKITASDGAGNYAWQEQRRTADGLHWEDETEGITGTLTNWPAREITGSTVVPVGEFGQIWLSEDGTHWLFMESTPSVVENLTIINSLTIGGITINVTGGDTFITYDTTVTIINYGDVIYPGAVTATFLTKACYSRLTTDTHLDSGGAVTINSTTAADVLTITFTLADAGQHVLIDGAIAWNDGDTVDDVFHGLLLLDGAEVGSGSPLSERMVAMVARPGWEGSTTWPWSAKPGAGSHTVKLQAKRASGSGTIKAYAAKLRVHADGSLLAERSKVLLPAGSFASDPLCTANPSDCCTESSGGSGGSGGPCAGNPTCVFCTGVAPTTWAVTLAGFTGCGIDPNADWTLAQAQPDQPSLPFGCQWSQSQTISGKPSKVVLSPDVGPDGSGALFLVVNNDTIYWYQFAAPIDCCAPVTLVLKRKGSCASVPATVTVTPDCDDCGSGGEGGACCGCDAVPMQYTLNAAGIVNGACATCGNLNGLFTLTLDEMTCVWSAPNADLCNEIAPLPAWHLECDGSFMYLYPGGSFAATPIGAQCRYKKALADWDCLGANTLAKDFDATLECDGWPANITVTPV